MIKLEKEIVVLVPKNDNSGNPLNFSNEVGNIIDVAGGATVFDAKGLWNNDNKTYKDSMQAVQINTNEFSNDFLETLQRLIDSIFINGKQEAVSIVANGTLFILENCEDFLELKESLIK